MRWHSFICRENFKVSTFAGDKPMRQLLFVLLACGILLAGCALFDRYDFSIQGNSEYRLGELPHFHIEPLQKHVEDLKTFNYPGSLTAVNFTLRKPSGKILVTSAYLEEASVDPTIVFEYADEKSHYNPPLSEPSPKLRVVLDELGTYTVEGHDPQITFKPFTFVVRN